VWWWWWEKKKMWVGRRARSEGKKEVDAEVGKERGLKVLKGGGLTFPELLFTCKHG